MRDVADEADRQPLHAAFDPANGEDVEEPLRWMLVRPVSGVDDAAMKMLGQKMRRAGRGMAHRHHVDAHRFDVLRRIDERLALTDAGSAGREIKDIGAQPFRSETKARTGAGGRLKKEIDDHLAFEVATFLTAALADVDEILSSIENNLDFLPTQLFES